MQFSRTWVCLALLALICSFTPNSALAQDGLDSGDTAWILISTGLVLFMMIPGLAMFYAGLVGSRNVLSIFIHCFGITALITVIWTLCGYGLAFTANNPFIGDLSKSFLSGITGETLVGSIPELLFFVFQMTSTIITPGLFVGAFAERMKFSAIMWFSGLWCLLVYIPITHMVWGEAGFFSTMGVFDFAGGIVMHITAGTAGLAAITPASGWVGPMGAMAIGFVASVVAYWESPGSSRPSVMTTHSTWVHSSALRPLPPPPRSIRDRLLYPAQNHRRRRRPTRQRRG